MRLLNLAPAVMADVAMPQATAFAHFPFQFRALWAIVHTGRTQAACTSHKGAAQSTLPAIKWSRGCRALRLPFWHFAWSPSWLPAPRKLKKSFTWTSRRLRPSLSTPANTSKTKGRALWAVLARPALFLSAVSAEHHRSRALRFASAAVASYGDDSINHTTQRPSCAPHLFSSFCLSALSRLAPSLHPSRLLTPSRCRKSLFRLANTSDLTGRAGSLRPAHPDRPFISKVQSC